MPVKRGLLVSRGWVQAVAIVVVFGFLVLGILAWQTYEGEPPIPGRTTDPDGRLLFSRDDVIAGQGVFLRNGLMEYGSIFGHGAYLGPDFTADYLHRAALSVLKFYGGPGSSNAAGATVSDFRTNQSAGGLVLRDWNGPHRQGHPENRELYVPCSRDVKWQDFTEVVGAPGAES